MTAHCRLSHDFLVHETPVDKHFQRLGIAVFRLYFDTVYDIPFINNNEIQLILLIDRKADLVFFHPASGVGNFEQPVQFVVHKSLCQQPGQGSLVNHVSL